MIVQITIDTETPLSGQDKNLIALLAGTKMTFDTITADKIRGGRYTSTPPQTRTPPGGETMTRWTAEILDALPCGTVIEWEEEGGTCKAVMDHFGIWTLVGAGEGHNSMSVYEEAVPGSIRVISLPVDAPLSRGVPLATFEEVDISGVVRNSVEDAISHASPTTTRSTVFPTAPTQSG